MRSENQRALESSLAAYERAFASAQQQQQLAGRTAASPGGGSAPPPPELHEGLDAAHAAAVQAAMVEFGQQVRGRGCTQAGGSGAQAEFGQQEGAAGGEEVVGKKWKGLQGGQQVGEGRCSLPVPIPMPTSSAGAG